MSRTILGLSLAGLLGLAGCSSDSTTEAPGASGNGGNASGNGGSSGSDGGSTSSGGSTSTGGSTSGTGGNASANGGSNSGGGGTTGSGGSTGSGGGNIAGSTGTGGTSTGSPSYNEVKGWIDAYHTAHPGAAGDITIMTDAQLAADPDAKRLHDLCGPGQLPVIPLLTWEYGGGDHAWINPDQSPLVICVYVATKPDTDHWKYDAANDHITADVYVLFPDQNPCHGQAGKAELDACMGDPSNIEILVDTSSIRDGADAGLQLANSSTDLNLIRSDGTTVFFGTVA